jgi:hypothetical protein
MDYAEGECATLIEPRRDIFGLEGQVSAPTGPKRQGVEFFGAPGAMIGGTLFFVVLRASLLNPQNIAWLYAPVDSSAYYIAAAYFLKAGWALPPGANPDYGIEVASSIFYADAIPLMTLLLKPFRSLLSEPFQYFGVWLFACFVLQGLFAWKISTALGLPKIAKASLSAFSIFVPSLLQRLEWGHYPHSGHWLILAAIYLYLRALSNGALYWPFLLFVSSLVNSYLFAMVVAIWIASILRQLMGDRWTPLLYELPLSVISPILGLWLAGFFMVAGSGLPAGFGHFRMNLLSPIDSDGWSYFFPDLPGVDGDVEGFNFLGAGYWFLIVLAVPGILRCHYAKLLEKRWLPLALACVFLLLFSISNNVAAGPYEIGSVSLPTWAENVAGMLRSSGRMFWPIVYLGLFFVGWCIVQTYGARLGTFLLFFGLSLQVLDTSARWLKFFEPPSNAWTATFAERGRIWPTFLQSSFWDKAAGKYQRIRVLGGSDPSPELAQPRLKDIAYYALTHGMPTNAVRLARESNEARLARQQAVRLMSVGSFDEGAIYIVDRELARLIKEHARTDDLLTMVDGMYVFAPGGAALVTGPTSNP